MTTLHVFDPAMCCPTGVCGPQVDPALPRFASDLDHLASMGIQVTRYNLAQEPGAFAAEPLVKELLQTKGNDCLPLLVLDGKVISEGAYPDRPTLLALVGLNGVKAGEALITPAVQELLALAVAMSTNSDQAFRFHYDQARKLGVPKEDMIKAVDIALTVQDGSSRTMLLQARKYLGIQEASACAPGSGCC
ncbi:MAG: arsenite efflux transporter metallochaperone ArsD [Acidobacteria bacterium]|nr:arsenite efflux transporter metallochaperone ArsD [Acidobacteriota bacterium]